MHGGVHVAEAITTKTLICLKDHARHCTYNWHARKQVEGDAVIKLEV